MNKSRVKKMRAMFAQEIGSSFKEKADWRRFKKDTLNYANRYAK